MRVEPVTEAPPKLPGGSEVDCIGKPDAAAHPARALPTGKVSNLSPYSKFLCNSDKNAQLDRQSMSIYVHSTSTKIFNNLIVAENYLERTDRT